MSVVRPLSIAVLCVASVLSACGGGGVTRSVPPVLPSAGPATQAVHVSIVVPAPPSSTSSSTRKPQFVSPSTLGASMKVTNAASTSTVTVAFDLSPASNSCTLQANQRLCNVSVSVPLGNDTFSITTYDAAPVNGSIPASAHMLGTGSVTQSIDSTFTGALTFAVDAAVNGFGALPAFSSLPADGATHTYLFVLNPRDFDNNAIVNGSSDPFMNPIGVALTETGGSGHAHLLFNGNASGTSATLKASSDSIAVQYDGGGSPGYAIAVAFTATGVSPMTTALSPLYVTSSSAALSHLSLQLAGSASTVPFSIDEVNAPAGTAFTATATTCANVASVGSVTQNGSHATFSVSGGSVSSSCKIDVSDGTSTVSIAATNSAPATPTPAPTSTPTPAPTPTPSPTPTPTPTPTPVPTATPVPTWTTVPLGPSLYVSNGVPGELATFPLTGWVPSSVSPYNTNLPPTTLLDYHDYTAGGLICYDAAHNYVWATSSATDTVTAYPANAKGTNVPAVMTLAIGALNGYPSGCAVDSSGNVYVTAYGAFGSGTPDMLIIYPSGSTTAGTVIRGTNAGLNIPRKPAIDSAGNIYVADSTGKDVRVFLKPGTNAGIIDVAPSRLISYAFTNPWGVTVDAGGHVYVADPSGIAGNVEVFPAGTTNAAGSTPLFVLTGANQIPSGPNGVVIDPNGNLWVACTFSLQEFDSGSVSNALSTHVAPNPYASIWGSSTTISGASGIDAH